MASSRPSFASARLATFVAVILIIVVLYFAREVLIPLALGILLSFLLAPMVIRLQRLGVPRFLSAMLVTALSFAVIGLLGWIVAGQVIDVATKLPEYRTNIRHKIESLMRPSTGLFNRASKGIKEITSQVAEVATQPNPENVEANPANQKPPTTEPVPVQITEKPPNLLGSAAEMLVSPLTSAGMVIVFVFLILNQREDLRDRVIGLIGSGRLTLTTQALDDAAERVSRYLMALLVVNTTFGVAAGVGLYLIGVPNAILWGVLAGVARFVPYIGPWIGAALPIILSMAVFDNWSKPLITVGWFVIIELLINNVVEPLVYGSRTGMTPLAVVAAAVFWGWLWGPVGLVLAVPLTVCLVVIGRYVPRLEFLSTLLGDQPALPPEARIYQRLLAMDHDEVHRLSNEYLKSMSLIELYDRVLIPALRMAEHDRHRGVLELGREQFVYGGMRDLIDTLGEQDANGSGDNPENTTAHTNGSNGKSDAPCNTSANGAASCVLCLPARDEADELVGIMLAQLLRHDGVSAEAISVTSLAGEMLEIVAERSPSAVVVSAMPPLAVLHSRYMCKRLLARFGVVKIVVGMWSVTDLEQARQRLKSCGPDRLVATLAQALDALRT